jgi:hypothetical protein
VSAEVSPTEEAPSRSAVTDKKEFIWLLQMRKNSTDGHLEEEGIAWGSDGTSIRPRMASPRSSAFDVGTA